MFCPISSLSDSIAEILEEISSISKLNMFDLFYTSLQLSVGNSIFAAHL
jgi:hypothetical protein